MVLPTHLTISWINPTPVETCSAEFYQDPNHDYCSHDAYIVLYLKVVSVSALRVISDVVWADWLSSFTQFVLQMFSKCHVSYSLY